MDAFTTNSEGLPHKKKLKRKETMQEMKAKAIKVMKGRKEN